jgi:hypothetical protein
MSALATYGNKLAKASGALTQAQGEHVRGVCQIAFNKGRYPSNWDMKGELSVDEEFQEFRSDIASIFRAFAKAGPGVIKEFLMQASVQVLGVPVASVNPHDVEALLSLIHSVPEAIPEHALKVDDPAFNAIINTLIGSGIAAYPSEAIVTRYFGIVWRYSKFICSQPQLLGQVLQGFVGDTGIRHPIAALRGAACHYFQKFVKTNRSSILPMMDSILSSLVGCLDIQEPSPLSSGPSPSLGPSPSPSPMMVPMVSPLFGTKDAGGARSVMGSSGAGQSSGLGSPGIVGAGGGGGGGGSNGGVGGPLASSAQQSLSPGGTSSSASAAASALSAAAAASAAGPTLVAGFAPVAGAPVPRGGSGRKAGARGSVGGRRQPRPADALSTLPSFEDQVKLFEAVGQLVGGEGFQPGTGKQEAFIEAIMAPLSSRITAAVAANAVEEHATLVSMLIWAMGHVTKGFNPATCELPRAVACMKEGTQACLAAQRACPVSQLILSRSIFYYHRMVSCLGDEFLPLTQQVISQVFATRSLKDLAEAVRLCNQLAVKFKAKLAPMWDAILVPTIATIFAVVQSGTPTSPDDLEVEQEDLQRGYYTFLHTLLCSETGQVFLSPTNQAHLLQILGTVLEGCTKGSASVQKLCFSVAVRTVELWAQQGTGEGYTQYACANLVPAAFMVPLAVTFNLDDAANNLTLAEIAGLHRAMLERYIF